MKEIMITAVTEGIKVSVETSFDNHYSSHLKPQFVFTYKINIENNSNYTIQLLRRQWTIVDGNGQQRHVEGPGVIGQQPIIEPGATFEYASFCNLMTNIGKMEGKYLMQRKADNELFFVDIPAFSMLAPYLSN